MGEPGAAFAGEIARQLNLLRQWQHVRIEPCTKQHLGLDILRGAVRFRLAENAGEAAEDLQECGNGGVVEGHAMLFRDLDGCCRMAHATNGKSYGTIQLCREQNPAGNYLAG